MNKYERLKKQMQWRLNQLQELIPMKEGDVNALTRLQAKISELEDFLRFMDYLEKGAL